MKIFLLFLGFAFLCLACFCMFAMAKRQDREADDDLEALLRDE